MKRYLLILLMLVVGCSGIQMTGETQDVIARLTARRIARELVKQAPEIREPGIAICREIAVSQDDEAIRPVLIAGAAYLAQRFDDPLLKYEIADLLSLIQIEPGKYRMDLVRAAAVGFGEGLQL